MQNFQGLIKNKWNFQGRPRKIHVKFPRDVTYIHNFTKFPGVELCFAWISTGTERNKKKFQGFFLKRTSSAPLFFFPGIAHSKTIDLNWSYEALAQKEALTSCQDRAFASFLCVLSLASVLGRFTHLYCDNGSLGRGAPLHGK